MKFYLQLLITGTAGLKTIRDKLLTTLLSYCVHIDYNQNYTDTYIPLFTKATYKYAHTSHLWQLDLHIILPEHIFLTFLHIMLFWTHLTFWTQKEEFIRRCCSFFSEKVFKLHKWHTTKSGRYDSYTSYLKPYNNLQNLQNIHIKRQKHTGFHY